MFAAMAEKMKRRRRPHWPDVRGAWPLPFFGGPNVLFCSFPKKKQPPSAYGTEFFSLVGGVCSIAAEHFYDSLGGGGRKKNGRQVRQVKTPKFILLSGRSFGY